MNSFKTSYILTKCEILFLLSKIPNITPSNLAQHLLSQYLSNSIGSQDAVEGLVYKKLVRKSSWEIVLEPVVDLLARLALSADTLWIAECLGIANSVLVLKAKDIYLYVQRYPHIANAWKITPYQSKDALLGEFDELTVTEVMRIGKDGLQQPLKVNDNISWIKDGGE